MRLIIEARLEGAQTGATPAEATIVDVLERQDHSVADLGLTLAEGRALLAKVQSILVSQQTAGWMASQVACCRCGSVLAHKDSRSIVMRTVFGKVEVPSPRLWACSCAGKQGEPRRSVSPLCKAVRQRVTPELEYLQAKWAAHLPYRQATELLREVLPLDKAISLGSTRRRILAQGIRLAAACLLITVDSHKPATAKTPKAALLYQNRPRDGQHCGDCKYFSPEGSGAANGTCALVEGVVDRDGWCMAYVART